MDDSLAGEEGLYGALLKTLQADMEENPASISDLSALWDAVKRMD